MVITSFLCLVAFTHDRRAVAQESQPVKNALSAQDSAEEFSWPANPRKGTTVVFLGDSITHQALYTQYLETFFWTRYPDRDLTFHNAGVAGDSISDALARFEWDVAEHQPDYVTLLFGMNDGRYEDLNLATFEKFRVDLGQLLDRIEAIGAKPILLSPTMFDHAVVTWRAEDVDWRFRGKMFSPNYNALMALMGGWAHEASRRRGHAFVNLWAPLNAITDRERRDDPRFTMIADAIHPQASGQVVMAFEILMQLGVERRIANTVALTKRGTRWVGGKGVGELKMSEDGQCMTFVHLAKAIPWVIPQQHATRPLRWLLPSDGRHGYELTHAGHKLSADRLRVAGLDPGDYEVRIDGTLIGVWSHLALGSKIELQTNPKTPQYQQALQVAKLNRQRTDDFVRPMRDKSSSIKGMRRRLAADQARFTSESANVKSAIRALELGAEELASEIRSAATPRQREWEIRRVSTQ